MLTIKEDKSYSWQSSSQNRHVGKIYHVLWAFEYYVFSKEKHLNIMFFHRHGAWISNSSPIHSMREFFTLGVKLIMCDRSAKTSTPWILTGVNFHTVKLRVSTFSRHETCRGWMKSNLFFFVLCFFSPLFELGKNENTWSCQAKFVEVDPTQKIIFLLAYSSRFK